jgi:hypothetical protein
MTQDTGIYNSGDDNVEDDTRHRDLQYCDDNVEDDTRHRDLQ